MENVAKNIHLFDDVFGKLKADHTRGQQLQQLSQLGLMNFGLGQASGGIAFHFPGNSNAGNQTNLEVPPCFDYFQELYQSRKFEYYSV